MRTDPAIRGPLGGVLFALLVVSLLSGCLAKDPALDPDSSIGDADDDVVAPDGRDLRTDLTAKDELPVPKWRLGDWWGIHIYFGSQGGEGQHVNVVVTDAADDGYLLATDDAEVAKQHALFDYPILGTILTEDLAMTGIGGVWDWFAFPLTDGATWTGEMPNIAFDILPDGPVTVLFTATYTDALQVEGKTVPGYTVAGTTEDGTLLIEYTYAPSVRWLTSATVYDIDPGQDPIEFTLELMGHGRGWTGTYYIGTARVLLENHDGAGLSAPPPHGVLFADPSPHATFTVSSDATYLVGFMQNHAAVGVRTTLLVPPEGDPRHYDAVGAPESNVGMWIDEAATPGEWRLITTGTGAMTRAYVWLAEIVETTGTL